MFQWKKRIEKVKSLVILLRVVFVLVPWAQVSLPWARFPSGESFPSDLFVTGGWHHTVGTFIRRSYNRWESFHLRQQHLTFYKNYSSLEKMKVCWVFSSKIVLLKNSESRCYLVGILFSFHVIISQVLFLYKAPRLI